MKKKYESPNLEILHFSLMADVLQISGEDTGELPEFPGGEINTLVPMPIKSSGFGW